MVGARANVWDHLNHKEHEEHQDETLYQAYGIVTQTFVLVVFFVVSIDKDQ